MCNSKKYPVCKSLFENRLQKNVQFIESQRHTTRGKPAFFYTYIGNKGFLKKKCLFFEKKFATTREFYVLYSLKIKCLCGFPLFQTVSTMMGIETPPPVVPRPHPPLPDRIHYDGD